MNSLLSQRDRLRFGRLRRHDVSARRLGARHRSSAGEDGARQVAPEQRLRAGRDGAGRAAVSRRAEASPGGNTGGTSFVRHQIRVGEGDPEVGEGDRSG